MSIKKEMRLNAEYIIALLSSLLFLAYTGEVIADNSSDINEVKYKVREIACRKKIQKAELKMVEKVEQVSH